MKKILVISANYSVYDDNPKLTNDLVNELERDGNLVQVVALGDGSVDRIKGTIEEIVINVKSQVKYFKYFIIWPLLFFKLMKVIKKFGVIDQVIMTAPLTVMWPAALLLKYMKVSKKTAIIFDIFPIHQQQIGAIPNALAPMAKALECFLLGGFSEVTAMGNNNKEHIGKYFESVLKKKEHARKLDLALRQVSQ